MHAPTPVALILFATVNLQATEVALIGEICGNLEALTAVMEDIRSNNIQEVICLGGIVGYGASPNECIDLIRTMQIRTVKGEMESLLNKDPLSLTLNAYARASIDWTRGVITKENQEWALSLPVSLEVRGAFVCNATVHNPDLYNYIMTVADAQLSFDALATIGKSLAFVAHSNVPVVFIGSRPITYSLDKIFPLDDSPTIVNVGSVGQPRDEDKRACYQIWDVDNKTVRQIRIEYNIKAAQEKIRAAGLPDILAARLEHGK